MVRYTRRAIPTLYTSSLKTWQFLFSSAEFDLRHFLCSESEQLIWKSEGLPSDDLSMENALVILQVKHTHTRAPCLLKSHQSGFILISWFIQFIQMLYTQATPFYYYQVAQKASTTFTCTNRLRGHASSADWQTKRPRLLHWEVALLFKDIMCGHIT